MAFLCLHFLNLHNTFSFVDFTFSKIEAFTFIFKNEIWNKCSCRQFIFEND